MEIGRLGGGEPGQLEADRAGVARVAVDEERERAAGGGQRHLAAGDVAAADGDGVADAGAGGQAAEDRLVVRAVGVDARGAGPDLRADVGGGLEHDGEAVVAHVLHVRADRQGRGRRGRRRLGARRAAGSERAGGGDRGGNDERPHYRLRVAIASRLRPAALASSITATTRP